MTTGQVKKAMDDFSDMGTISWSFTGGEPLLRGDIGELINYAKSKDFKTSMVTNGSLVKKKLDEIRNIDILQVSLDGPEHINDKLRGKGSYKRAVEGLKIARDSGIPVRVATVLLDENMADGFSGLSHVIDMAMEMGDEIIVQPVYKDPWNSVKELDKENLLISMEFLKRKKKEYGKLMIPKPYFSWVKDFIQGKKIRCSAGRSVAHLFPDGRLAPCYFMEQNSVDGLSVGFNKAFSNLKFPDNCACLYLCYMEFTFAMSLNPFSIVEYIRRWRYMG
jgi:MoaA/NifB/PqqE/SkfB family radical SAM enzyme